MFEIIMYIWMSMFVLIISDIAISRKKPTIKMKTRLALMMTILFLLISPYLFIEMQTFLYKRQAYFLVKDYLQREGKSGNESIYIIKVFSINHNYICVYAVYDISGNWMTFEGPKYKTGCSAEVLTFKKVNKTYMSVNQHQLWTTVKESSGNGAGGYNDRLNTFPPYPNDYRYGRLKPIKYDKKVY